MKKLLIVFLVAITLVLSGCTDIAGLQASLDALNDKITNLENGSNDDAYMSVVGFEIKVDGYPLDTESTTGADLVQHKEVLDSVLGVSGLKTALENAFPTWNAQGATVPFTQEYTVHTSYIVELLKLAGKTANIVVIPDDPSTDEVETETGDTTISISLENRDVEGGDIDLEGIYEGEYIIIDFDTYVDPNYFEQIVFEYADAIDEAIRDSRANAFDEDDVRNVVKGKITGYQTYFPNDPDEDDLLGHTTGSSVVFSPDNGQVKYYGSSSALISSLESVSIIYYDHDNDDTTPDVSIDVTTTIGNDPITAIEDRNENGGTTGNLARSLIVTIEPKVNYTTAPSNYTAKNNLNIAGPTSGYTANSGTLNFTSTGTFTGSLEFDTTETDGDNTIENGEDIGAKTIEEALSDIEGILNTTTLTTALSGSLPTFPLEAQNDNFSITAITARVPAFGNQPDYMASTIDVGETVTFVFDVEFTVGGRTSSKVNAPYYSFSTSKLESTKTVTLNVTVTNSARN